MAAFVSSVIQPIVDFGYGLAATFLGQIYNHYRPQSTGPVLVNFNMIEQIPFMFDATPNFSQTRPHLYASDQTYYGAFDSTNTKIGDYFTNGGSYVFYVANWEPLRPPAMMLCNRVVTIQRPSGNGSVSNGYGGNTAPVTLLTGWPASIIKGGISNKPETGTPESINDHGMICYIPYYVPIATYDIVIDDLNRRYIIGENEQTELGYRLSLAYETA
jgi:hypothetical protein